MGVIGLLQKVIVSIYFVTGCSNRRSSYSVVSGFDIADHMADLHYYYFKSSTRGKRILLEFLKFLNMEWESHGKNVITGWLLLENCVEK